MDTIETNGIEYEVNRPKCFIQGNAQSVLNTKTTAVRMATMISMIIEIIKMYFSNATLARVATIACKRTAMN